ncbi:MAG: GyrI-like domain-containing protein [Candidatus Aminicenantales bacterium]
MKRNVWIISLGFIFALSALPLASGAGQAQGGSVTIQKSEAFVYVCLEEKGPFEGIQHAIGRLVQEMQGQNVVPAGPLLGIYYNSPEEVSDQDLRWEVGFPVTAQALIQPPLMKKEWGYSESAVCLHQGAYEDTGETISKMLDWMDDNGYRPEGPIMERYLDMNPEELSPEQLKTEVWIPCQKRT